VASQSISKTFGQTEFQLTAGTAVPGAGDIELRVNLANLPTPDTTYGGNASIIQFLMEAMNYFTGKSVTQAS